MPEVDEARTADCCGLACGCPARSPAFPGFPCYRTVEETFASAAGPRGRAPDLATWIDIGDSWEKQTGRRPARLRHDGPAAHELRRPGTQAQLISRGHPRPRVHDRGADDPLRGAPRRRSTASTPTSPGSWTTRRCTSSCRPTPTGASIAEAGPLWRKNTDPDYGCAIPNSWGIDLNRNFPFLWGCCGGLERHAVLRDLPRAERRPRSPRRRPCADYVLAQLSPDYGDPWGTGLPQPSDDAAGMFLDIHSYGQLVLWPWGYTTEVGAQRHRSCRPWAASSPSSTTTPRSSPSSSTSPTGPRATSATATLGVASFTFELGTNFFQDCCSFENTICPTNLQALLYAARVTRAPYMWPAGPERCPWPRPAGAASTSASRSRSARPSTTRGSINTNGTEPAQTIAAAEVYVDTPPWAPGAVPLPLSRATAPSTSRSRP